LTRIQAKQRQKVRRCRGSKRRDKRSVVVKPQIVAKQQNDYADRHFTGARYAIKDPLGRPFLFEPKV
jgi:hypothetical protein